MVSEIDWLSINRPLAQLLGLTVPHFNAMETAIFAGLNFDVGVTEEKFKSKVQAMDKLCLTLFNEAEKSKKAVTVLASEPATPSQGRSSADSSDLGVSSSSKFNPPKHAKLINTTEETKL